MVENIAMSCIHCDITIVYCITLGNIYVRQSKTHNSGHLFTTMCHIITHNVIIVIINVVIIQIVQHSGIHCAYVLQLTFDIGLGTIRLS